MTEVGKKVMVVGDSAKLRMALAAVAGFSGLHPMMLDQIIPRAKAGNRYEPHQGAKERAKRLKRLHRG